jgi:hypothetical protein
MVVMENGDKFFARAASVIQSVSGKLTATTVAGIIGGTRRLARIEGTVRQVVSFDPRPGAPSSTSSTRSASNQAKPMISS